MKITASEIGRQIVVVIIATLILKAVQRAVPELQRVIEG